MNDLGEALTGSARSSADAVVAEVAAPDSVAASAAAIRADRRMRGRRRVGAAVVAVVALAGLVWVMLPTPIPMTVAEGVVREVDPVLLGPEVGWCRMGDGSDIFPAWAEPGAAIADETVRDSGIEVEARFLGRNANRPELHPLAVAEVIDVTPEDAHAGSGLDFGDEPRVAELWIEFRVSWAGQRHYTADALGMLTAGERLVTYPVMVTGSADWRDAGFGEAWFPQYDPGTDRTTVVVSTPLLPVCAAVSTNSWAASVPGEGDLRLRTVVQVRDENGDALATLVDVTGLEDTQVTYDRLRELDRTYEVEPVTDAERVASQRLWQTAVARVPSPRAVLEEQLEESGEPLADVGVGFTLGMSCTDLRQLTDEPMSMPVLAADAEPPVVADSLSIWELEHGGLPVSGATLSDVDYSWLVAHVLLLFIGDDGLISHTLITTPTFGSDAREVESELTLRPSVDDYGAACGELADLQPGSYGLVGVMPGVVWSAQSPRRYDELAEFGLQIHTWMDLGTITLEP